MPLKIKMTDSGNTCNIAVHIMKMNNFEISTEPESDLLIARFGEVTFKSEDPLSLLSITFLKDSRIEEWHQSIHIDNYSQLAINHLLREGFAIKMGDDYSDDWYDIIAQKKEIMLIAKTPLRLLGLHIISNTYHDTWNTLDIPNYCSDLFA